MAADNNDDDMIKIFETLKSATSSEDIETTITDNPHIFSDQILLSKSTIKDEISLYLKNISDDKMDKFTTTSKLRRRIRRLLDGWENCGTNSKKSLLKSDGIGNNSKKEESFNLMDVIADLRLCKTRWELEPVLNRIDLANELNSTTSSSSSLSSPSSSTSFSIPLKNELKIVLNQKSKMTNKVIRTRLVFMHIQYIIFISLISFQFITYLHPIVNIYMNFIHF